MLVLGMLVALRPALWLGAVVMAGFLAEYAVIVVEEERDLSEGRSQSLEARSQSAELRMAVSGRREAESESFTLLRALCEWRTWVVTGVAFGLALVKAALRG